MGTYDTRGGTPRHDPAADCDAMTVLQEKLLELLEDAGIPTETNDRIIKLIEAAEWDLHYAALEADMKAEAEHWGSQPQEEPENPKWCPACGDDVADPIEGGYQCLACGCRWAP